MFVYLLAFVFSFWGFFTCSCSSFLREIKYQERKGKPGEDDKFAYEKEWLRVLLWLKGKEKERIG